MQDKSTMFVICYLLSFFRIQLINGTSRDKNFDNTVQSNVLPVMWSESFNHIAVILLHVVHQYSFVPTSFKESHHIRSLQISLDSTQIVFTHWTVVLEEKASDCSLSAWFKAD